MEEKKIKKTSDMTIGSPVINILKYAFPLLLGSLMYQLYNFADSIVVGNFVGKTALAAVGTTGVILWMASSVFVGFSAGAMILVSQYYGANRHDMLTAVVNNCCAITNILALPVIIIGIVLSRPILNMMHVPSDAYEQAHIYLIISFIGIAPLVGYNLNSGFLRGMGDSKSPLKFLVVSTIVNIILDILFVAVFKWGVAGAALATSLAQLISWIYSIIYIKKHYDWLEIKTFGFKCNKDLLNEMVKLGLPIGVNEVLFCSGIMLLQSVVNTHGSDFMAGFNVAAKLDALGYMSVDALYLAVTTFAGQNIGARKTERIKHSIKPTLLVSVVIVAAVTGMLIVFGNPFMSLFTPDKAVIDVGYAYLIRVMPFYSLVAMFNVLNGYMQGAGETLIPAVTNLVSVWFIRLPAAYIINHFLAAENLFFCYACGWTVNLLLTIILFNKPSVKKKVYGLN